MIDDTPNQNIDEQVLAQIPDVDPEHVDPAVVPVYDPEVDDVPEPEVEQVTPDPNGNEAERRAWLEQ